MVALLCFMFAILASPFKSKIRLEAENTALRHQLIVLRRQVCGRVRHQQRPLALRPALSVVSVDPESLTIIRPETLIGWHRAGFPGTGAGNHVHGEGARKSRRTYAR